MSAAESPHTLRVVVAGAGGRMGSALRELIGREPGWEIAALVDPHPAGESPLWHARIEDVTAPADGVVEFTQGGVTGGIARNCAGRGWPLVSGTTGLTDADRRGLEEASRRIPILQASNLSLGIALLRRSLTAMAAALPPATEMEIVEIHHAGKRDAPSGTARALFEHWRRLRGEPLREVCGRSGTCGPRASDEVGIHALRLGEVIGEHRVLLALPGGERLEIAHQVSRRESFARGALASLARLVGRPPGLYGPDDLF